MAGSREERFVQQLNFSSASLEADWRVFKSQFEVFKVAKKFADMNDEEQIANLLVLMGPESVPIFSQFVFEEGDTAAADKTRVLDNVIKMFDDHFEPVRNVIFERVRFNSMRQGDLPLHQFITNLQTQAKHCDYGAMRDDLVRDRIVVGVADEKLREYLIDLDNLNLQRCITKAKQYISHHEQSARIAGDSVDSLRLVKSAGPGVLAPRTSADVPRPGPGVLAPRQGGSGGSGKPRVAGSGQLGKKCQFCDKLVHFGDGCPARRSKCNRCGLVGHWAAATACKGKAGRSLPVRELTADLEGLFLGSESD